MKKQLVSLALFLASTALFAQSPQATVTATKQSYSGGTVTATFAPLGTGSPSVTVVTGTINANGFFSVLVWNNTFFSYAPSVTQFQICGAAPNSGTCYTASVTITGNQDISSAFNGAPNPASSSGGGAPINSPAFTGNPTAPTQACGNNTGLATLAYVQNCAPSAPVSSVFGSTGAVVAALGQYNLSLIGAGATGAGLYDFSAATNLKLPVAAGYAATASGECGHDSTSHNFHCFDNAVDNFMALFPSSSPPTSGHMAGFLQAGNGAWTLQDLGLPGSSLWSGLGTPTGNLALTMAAFTSTYTYNAATGSADLFKLTDTVNNTGLGIMQHITTASGSTEIPWQADANGVGYQVNASGQMVGIGQTFPGYHSFQNGSGILPNLPSGSGGWVAPVSGGTPWLGQLPATIAAGIMHFATPASVYGVNVSQVTSSAIAGSDFSNFSPHTFAGNNTGSSAAPSLGAAIGVNDLLGSYVAGGGTAQAQTATLSPVATALTAGLEVIWKPTAANSSAAPTLAINGLAATAITKCGTTALIANDITTTAIADAIFDGTEFQLMNPQAAACGAGGSSAESSITAPTTTNTITETAAGDWVARKGVETANLTAPWSFANTNSTNSNTSIGILAGAAGTSTGGIGEVLYDVSGTGDIIRLYAGGSVASNVYTVGTLEYNVDVLGDSVQNGGSYIAGYQMGATLATFNGSCSSATTTNCTVTTGASLNPNGGWAIFGYGDGSSLEYVCYTSATSTTIVFGQKYPTCSASGRGSFGSTATTFATGHIAAAVWTQALSAGNPPNFFELQNGNFYTALPASSFQNQNNPSWTFGASVGSTSGYYLGGQTNTAVIYNCDTNGACIKDQTGNATLVTNSNAASRNISSQSITTQAVITGAITPAYPLNAGAASNTVHGQLESDCEIPWSQATGGTVQFAAKASAAAVALTVLEVDYAGAAGIATDSQYTAIGTSTSITNTSPTITSSTPGNNYFSLLKIIMNPGTTNSPTVQLYATGTTNAISVLAQAGCSSWH